MFLVVKDLGLHGHIVKRCSAKTAPARIKELERDYGVMFSPDGAVVKADRVGMRTVGSYELTDVAPPRVSWDEDGLAGSGPDGLRYRIDPAPVWSFQSARYLTRYFPKRVLPDGREIDIDGGQGPYCSTKKDAQIACQAHLDTGLGEIPA